QTEASFSTERKLINPVDCHVMRQVESSHATAGVKVIRILHEAGCPEEARAPDIDHFLPRVGGHDRQTVVVLFVHQRLQRLIITSACLPGIRSRTDVRIWTAGPWIARAALRSRVLLSTDRQWAHPGAVSSD